MDLVVQLAGAVAALALMAASVLYLLGPSKARALLKKVFTPLAVLVAVFVVLQELVGTTNRFAVLVGLALVSIAAYWIRERRVRKRETPKSLGKAERTPVLPRSGEEE